MMIGEANHQSNQTAWNPQSPRTNTMSSPLSVNTISPTESYLLKNYEAILTAFQRYLPSNASEPFESSSADDFDLFPGTEAYYSSDEFRMYDFKVRKCTRARAHDWTECPFAHPGEKARRRDPRRYDYSGTACTDFRKGNCKKGDACEFAHGVFECWLHPSRYRTQACKDGPNCKRRVCFFAHTPEELRVLSGQPSPRTASDYPFEESPPVSPMGSSLNELVASLRNIQLNKVKSMPSSSWCGGGLGSPRFGSVTPLVRPGFYSLPSTPKRPGIGYMWDETVNPEEPVMERVESGRELRARMFEKLSKENPLNSPDPPGQAPDVGWVSDLIM